LNANYVRNDFLNIVDVTDDYFVMIVRQSDMLSNQRFMLKESRMKIELEEIRHNDLINL
jgi:hypothetical protein